MQRVSYFYILNQKSSYTGLPGIGALGTLNIDAFVFYQNLTEKLIMFLVLSKFEGLILVEGACST